MVSSEPKELPPHEHSLLHPLYGHCDRPAAGIGRAQRNPLPAQPIRRAAAIRLGSAHVPGFSAVRPHSLRRAALREARGKPASLLSA